LGGVLFLLPFFFFSLRTTEDLLFREFTANLLSKLLDPFLPFFKGSSFSTLRPTTYGFPSRTLADNLFLPILQEFFLCKSDYSPTFGSQPPFHASLYYSLSPPSLFSFSDLFPSQEDSLFDLSPFSLSLDVLVSPPPSHTLP